MSQPVRRSYDNSRREAGALATRLRVIYAAKKLFIEQGYPATKIESIAEASDTPLPTLYRLFGSKRSLLKAVLDTSFVGDTEPVGLGDRAHVEAALSAADPGALIDAFAVICRELMDRSGEIYHVLATAALVDDEAAELLADIRRQAHTGRSRIVAALRAMDALDPALGVGEAEDIVYTCLSFEVARILTVERAWSAEQYESWISRSLRGLLRPDRRRRTSSRPNRQTKEAGCS
jgi:AcrR family transcriptional regulator